MSTDFKKKTKKSKDINTRKGKRKGLSAENKNIFTWEKNHDILAELEMNRRARGGGPTD